MRIVHVSDIMSNRPVSIGVTESIYGAAHKMKQFKVSSLVVLENKELVGIITVDDVVREVIAEKLSYDTPVADVMIRKVVTVSPGDDIRHVMTTFNEFEIRQAPVLDGKKLVGFVTLKDILRFEPALLDIAVENLRNEEEQRQETIKRMMNIEEMPDEDFF